jgi:poly(hydroxyalkanoate) granule-associated protein
VTEKKETKPQAESPAEQILAVGKAAVETAQEAIAKAQETVEKIQQEGSKILQSLVKESGKVFDETQKRAGEKVDEIKERVEEARHKAAETLDNLEQIFEERVSRALNRLGIPTREDFQAIAKRLEDLNHSVQALLRSKAKGAASAPAAEKDDLKEISGIGPAMENKLKADGITTFRQIAQLSSAEVERIETEVINSTGRIQRENWIAQAKELHLKKYGEPL